MSARRDVALIVAEHGLGERHACKLLEVDRSTCRYEPRPDRNAKLREALLTLAKQQPRYGYRRLWALLVRQGWEVDVKRVHRLYKAEGLMVRRLKRKRLIRTVALNPLLLKPPFSLARRAARRIVVASSRYGPMIWTPTGSPSVVLPAGATVAGQPVNVATLEYVRNAFM